MKLAEYMQREGLSQAEFARRTGLSQPMVCLWLSGKRRPGLESALAIESATAGEVPASSWLEAQPGASGE